MTKPALYLGLVWGSAVVLKLLIAGTNGNEAYASGQYIAGAAGAIVAGLCARKLFFTQEA